MKDINLKKLATVFEDSGFWNDYDVVDEKYEVLSKIYACFSEDVKEYLSIHNSLNSLKKYSSTKFDF